MSFNLRSLLSIVISMIWISISEFIRNSVLLRNYWIEHFDQLGIVFPENPINGAIWGVWSLSLAIGIFVIHKKSSLLHTILISWFLGFISMWLVIGNLGVLPYKILFIAIPLSLIEVSVAALIINKFSPKNKD